MSKRKGTRKAEWPRHSTAILIIHGIGEQNPFETLDAFTATCWSVLEERYGNGFLPGKHIIARRDGWLQNGISIARKERDSAAIDFYEYYWANKAERHVELEDIIDWLVTTSDGAEKFYKENEEIVKTYEGTTVKAFEKDGFTKHWYLKHLGTLVWLVSLIPILSKETLSRWVGPFLVWINPFFRKMKQVMIEFIGDVVIYTSTDIKSKFFEVRKQILDGAVEELRALLLDARYDKILVVGHSLGSVIGYDALDRINHQMNVGQLSPDVAKKIAGFVTFGSPLDKIAFFFREHTKDSEYLRRQILAHYHSFKAHPLTRQPNPRVLANPIKRHLEHAHWMNFWDVEDKVSGQLDFYDVDENIQLTMGKSFIDAHTGYWGRREMYERIVQQFFIAAR